ncbi:MAG: hypothetical protein Q9213_002123 [Squamulea squamosa]
MSIDNIVIPGGMLAVWDGPQFGTDDHRHDRREVFDATEVARRRARTLSVSILRPTHLDGNGPRRSEDIELSSERNRYHRQRQSTSAHAQTIRPPLLQRASTINLGGLGRSRVTGRNTPANRDLRLDRAQSVLGPVIRKTSQVAPEVDTIQELEETYVFQSLGNSQVPDRHNRTTSQDPPIFLSRDTPLPAVTARRESSPKKLGRSQSNTSQFSTIGVVRRASVIFENAVGQVKETVNNALRRSSLEEVYEKAKIRQVQLMRSNAVQIGFEYSFYLLLLASIYFVFVGVPLWNGLVLTIYYVFDMKLVVPAGTAIFLGIGFLYAYLPLLIPFEKEPPEHPPPGSPDRVEKGQPNDAALLIPCYKSEKLIGATLEAALKVFPAQNIFVVANGNSPTPLDNTAAVCEKYGVSHTWSPIGSKIVAQFVGCYVAKRFPYVLLIDDDCLLPPNFPIVTDRFTSRVKCIGYTIKSVGPNSSKGTLCQQAQDVEYKISGIQRAFAGKIGSATFPHGAISIWERELLIKTFQAHPGFSVSEDWFFGHVARQLGCRIQMCTAVFVETETPDSIFFSGGGARGGFGEMTIWKQRFFRWNFFFVSGLYYDLAYILCDWKLGWWELGAKLFVFQEVYETLLYLLAPFVLPISFYVRPAFSGYLYAATIMLYMVNVVIFNYVHLRSRHESVSVLCLLYYLPYKVILTFVNIASCYYSIYKYAKYFAKRHPKVIEDEKAVAVVLRLEEEAYSASEQASILAARSSLDSASQIGRRFTVTAVGTTLSSVTQQPDQGAIMQDIGVVDFADQARPQLETVPEGDVTNKAQQPPSRPDSRPPYIRHFSWHRSTSNNSSGSEVSPFDERKKSQFPLPSPETVMKEKLQTEDPVQATRRPSPVFFRRSVPSGCFREVSPERRPDARWPSDATGTSPTTPEYLPSIPRSIFRRSSSRRSQLPYNFPKPPINRPESVALDEPGQFIVISSAQDIGGGWPLRERPLSDASSQYILALADTGNVSRARRRGETGTSKERLFIAEDDVVEEEFEKEYTVEDRVVGQGRRKWRRGNSGRGRVSRGDDGYDLQRF